MAESKEESPKAQLRTILSCIDDAIPDDPHAPTRLDCIPPELSQVALDVLWELLDPKIVTVIGVKTHRSLPTKTLRRLAMKLTISYQQLPREFYLRDVHPSETESRAAGGFADVYIGSWNGRIVALKRLRVDTRTSDKDKDLHQQFCRESLLWRNLRHRHVIEFLGVSDDAFGLSICMVLPWMQKGNIRRRLGFLRQENNLSGQAYIAAVHQWMYQITLGLIYLHSEDLVHGDLHGGNILIDDDDQVLLTDFGMGVLADSTPQNYASKHGGGAYQYRSPELHDPDEFEMENDRPTTISDVYAFACVGVELYTERVPFEGLTYFNVCRLVMDGKRPSRPHTIDQTIMPNDMWDLTERCWAQQPEDRPTIHDVSDELATIIGLEQSDAAQDLEEPEASPQPSSPSVDLNPTPSEDVPVPPTVADEATDEQRITPAPEKQEPGEAETIAPSPLDRHPEPDVFVEVSEVVPTNQGRQEPPVDSSSPPPPLSKEGYQPGGTDHMVAEKSKIQPLATVKVTPQPRQEPLDEHKGGCFSRCIIA